MKPNVEELAELVGTELRTLGDVLDAADEVRSMGAGRVLASLGADGAVLVGADVRLHATAVAEEVRSTVGAGDSTLAGLLAALEAGADDGAALVRAVAHGTAAVQLPGSALPAPRDVVLDDARLHVDVERSRPIDTPGGPTTRAITVG